MGLEGQDHADGIVDQHKACLVAKGYAQEEGIDYEKTYDPTMVGKYIKWILRWIS